MSISMRQILFINLNKLLYMKLDVSGLLKICKSHPVQDL